MSESQVDVEDKSKIGHHSPEWKKMIFLMGIPLLILAVNFWRMQTPDPDELVDLFSENPAGFNAAVAAVGPNPPFVFLSIKSFDKTSDKKGLRPLIKKGYFTKEIWKAWRMRLKALGVKGLRVVDFPDGRRHTLFYVDGHKRVGGLGVYGYVHLKDDLEMARMLFGKQQITLTPIQGPWFVFKGEPDTKTNVPLQPY
uniref:Uncharacterized protein n=1 Tax=Magnetococcus massalia (strain MO-1) TaxID=451514 RepID=A0A1S7LLU5_MAGMO|nr:conserved protein of unknown function [Candidatus Magnetococcus massalia]